MAAGWNWILLLLNDVELTAGDITPKLARHLEFYDRRACRQLDWRRGMRQHVQLTAQPASQALVPSLQQLQLHAPTDVAAAQLGIVPMQQPQ